MLIGVTRKIHLLNLLFTKRNLRVRHEFFLSRRATAHDMMLEDPMADPEPEPKAVTRPTAAHSRRHGDQTPMLHVALLANYARAQRARIMRWSTLGNAQAK